MYWIAFSKVSSLVITGIDPRWGCFGSGAKTNIPLQSIQYQNPSNTDALAHHNCGLVPRLFHVRTVSNEKLGDGLGTKLPKLCADHLRLSSFNRDSIVVHTNSVYRAWVSSWLYCETYMYLTWYSSSMPLSTSMCSSFTC